AISRRRYRGSSVSPFYIARCVITAVIHKVQLMCRKSKRRWPVSRQLELPSGKHFLSTPMWSPVKLPGTEPANSTPRGNFPGHEAFSFHMAQSLPLCTVSIRMRWNLRLLMEGMMGTVVLVLLVLLLIGALPTWPYSSGWGYYPSGGLGLVLLIVLILALTGRICPGR